MLVLRHSYRQVPPSIHANGLPEVFSRPGSRTNVASIAISVDPMPNYGGGGNGSISFYSSANGHCGSVSSLRSGVSDNSQGKACSISFSDFLQFDCIFVAL